MTETTTAGARRRTSADEPSIWLGCLACYNAGRLVGHWFSAIGVDEATLADVHAGSRVDYAREGCEEIWGLDTDNIPTDGEMGAMEAAEWGRCYEEVGAEQWSALCAWVRSGSYIAEGDTAIPCVADFDDRFCGTWDSFDDYCYQLADDICLFEGLPDDHVAVTYFNWQSWIADQRFDHVVEHAPDGGVYVFRNM